ncbi:MAG: hypothetical protein J6J45_08600, partial [Clostridia bacterium]|nr:hypothetical protein [Clostridia bacterium]
LIVVLIPVATALLVYAFMFSTQSSVVSIVAYVVSAYTLTVACCRMPEIVKKTKNFLYSNKRSNLYLTDADVRARVSLNVGWLVNLSYSVFKLVLGIIYGSMWFLAEAEYYILLTVLRLWLIKSDKKHAGNSAYMWKCFNRCGWWLLFLNFLMACIISQVIFRNEVYEYNGLVIYASAAYTFYRLIMSIVQIVKYHSAHNPVLSASKRLNLSASLMSLFALQTAMLTQFGSMEGMSNRVANGATGAAVSVAVICISVMMILKSRKQLTIIKQN